MANKIGTHYNALIDATQALSQVHVNLIAARNAIEENDNADDMALRSKLCGMAEDVFGLRREMRGMISDAIDNL